MTYPIAISPGLGVTAAEIQDFDERWMSDAQRQHHLAVAENHLSGVWDPGPWFVGGELMAAMVRMYDLTGRQAYVDHLYDLSRLALDYRDDGPKKTPIEDPFRGRVMPAWGEDGLSSGELHWCGIDTAGLYSYPIAAFARIVAENPDLHASYGVEAVRMATAILETLRAYVDELDGRPNGTSAFVYPRKVRTLITPTRCAQAFINAKNALDPNLNADDRAYWIDRLTRIETNCNSLGKWGPRVAVPLNQAHALLMATIEEWRALETPFLRDQIGRSALAYWARGAFPRMIKETLAFFVPMVNQDSRGRQWLSWRYAQEVPNGVDPHTDDASHAGFSMRYFGVLQRNIERINVALFASGQEPFEVSRLRRGFSNTFVLKVGTGENLAHNVDGEVKSGLAVDRYNDACNGWLDLADIDDRVYYKCREIAQRVFVVDGAEGQHYLGIGCHASLLMNKPAITRRLVSRSAEFRTPPAESAPAAWLIEPPGGYNIAYRDTSGRLHELWRDSKGISGTTNLTASANNAPRAVGSPSAYVDTSSNTQIVLYRTSDGGINTLYWSSAEASHERLSPAGAPPADGDPVGWFRPSDGVHHVAYRTSDGHLHVLWWVGASPATHEHISASASRAIGNITAYRDPVRGDNLVFYRSADGHIRSLYWLHDKPREDDLSGVAGTPAAAGGPTAYYTPHDDTHQIVYRGSDGRIYELFSQAGSPVEGWVVSPAGAPLAQGNPSATYCAETNTKHVVYRSADGRLNELSWVPGAGTAVVFVDLTDFAAAPLAADDRVVAFTPERSSFRCVVYRGEDGEIYEVRW